MIAKYNRRSFRWGVPGLIMQVVGPILFMTWEGEAIEFVGASLALFGFVLLMIGFGYYVKAKDQHPAWAGMALLSWLGIFVLARLPDRHQRSIDRMNQGLCPTCAYDLRGDHSTGCPECGWKRGEGHNASGYSSAAGSN
ncbi:MAG: hypothetical protein V3T53_13805 [Phycisphaerales bacterium]